METQALPRLSPDAAQLADDALAFLDRMFSVRERAQPQDPTRDRAQRLALTFLRAALAASQSGPRPVSCGETAKRYIKTTRHSHLRIVSETP